MGTIEQNKQTVARVFDALRAGDVDALDDLIVVDYVQHNPQTSFFSTKTGRSSSTGTSCSRYRTRPRVAMTCSAS